VSWCNLLHVAPQGSIKISALYTEKKGFGGLKFCVAASWLMFCYFFYILAKGIGSAFKTALKNCIGAIDHLALISVN